MCNKFILTYILYRHGDFPDANLSDVENNCRNPDGDSALWCYKANTDTDKNWEYCDVPLCPGGEEIIFYESKTVPVQG